MEHSQLACLFVPDFPVEAVVRAEPELRDEAVAVLQGTAPLLSIAGVNERARQAGVEIGMTKLQAQGRLPALVLRRRSAGQESAAHAALLDCACAFSPRVEDNPAAPDTIVLDLSGLERLFGPLPKIARDLARRASELGLEANVAVAANPEAAIHAARGFAGVTLIPPGREAERLGPLPLEIIGQSEMLNTFDRWGVRTFRALAALPDTAVRERLGEAGVRWQRLARGEGSRPLVPAEPPLKFEEMVELEHPVALLEPLAFVLNRMLEQLCTRLFARALSTNELRLRLGRETPAQRRRDTEASDPESGTSDRDGIRASRPIPDHRAEATDEHEIVLRLPVPMLDAPAFLKLLQLELRSRPPGAPVGRIFLAAEPVQPRFTQGGLFLPSAPQPEKLEVTLGRIRRVVGCELRVASASDAQPIQTRNGERKTDYVTDSWPLTGDNCLGSPELLDTHRPDAFRMRKFVPKVATDRLREPGEKPLSRLPGENSPVAKTGSSLDEHSSRLSLRRFRPPVQVRVDVRDGRPVQIVPVSPPSAGSPQLSGSCLWAAGPWLESGEWWSPQPWSREVWDVALGQHAVTALYRLYRDTIRDVWYLEAMYD